ncbi:MAG: M1 family aminopeptidase [Gemmatimonadota bacterium]
MIPSVAPRIALLLSLVTLLHGCREPSAPPPVELGVSEVLARHRAGTLSEVRYDIALQIPEDRGVPLEGRTTITFTWSDPEAHPVVLDFKDPTERVREVRVNGAAVRWAPKDDHVVMPPEAFRTGENVVEVTYQAGDEALNRSDDFLYTLFVPDRAHFSLPVFDQPNLKGRVAWEIEVPAGWVAVANGPDLRSPGPETWGEDGPEDRRLYRFASSRPIPTYLFAFAAGRFRVEEGERGGVRMRMFHRETDPDAVVRNRDAIFDLHQTALDWLEDYTGIEYPFQKFDFVLIPPFQYGGMEHPGAITYRQSSLMLDESATQADLLGRASLIAHETAHMWFGDLVTMNWFDDVWTKEVFANFMAAKIVHPSFPEVDHRLRFLLAHHPRAYGVDRTPGANAIRQPLANLRDAGTLYGAIIYQKAPVVMAHLERTVGEELFREGMREYLSTYAYGNATWPDLIAILDRRSEEDLARWSRAWVEEPGRPTLRIVLVEGTEGPAVVVRQEDRWGRGRLWPQTLELVGSWDGALERTSVKLDSAEAEAMEWAGRATPDWVIPMGAGIEYGLVLMPPSMLSALSADLNDLDARLRGAAWIVLHDAVLEERLAPGDLVDQALAALPRETDELVLDRILGILGSVYWRLLTEEERETRAVAVEDAVWSGVTRTTARTPTSRFSFFTAYRQLASTPEAVERLRRIWAREDSVPGLPLSETQEIQLAEALAVRGVEDAEALLDIQGDRIQNPDRRARFDFVRSSLSSDPAVREAFFQDLRDPARREREPWVLAGLSYLHHPLRRDHGATLVPAALELVEEIQATGDIFFPTGWLSSNLGMHNSPEVAGAVAAYLERHPDLPAPLRGKVLQAGDGVRRAARIVHGADAAPGWRAPG